MILFLISLLAGILTALAPCTISLLPVIVGGTLSGERSIRRAVVVTFSLGISVIVFTLLLKFSSVLINVPPSFWQIGSGILIIFLGLTMIFPLIWEKIPGMNLLYKDSNKLLGMGYKKGNVAGDVLIGVALGPVFSSCSPTYFLILATVLPRDFATGFIYLLAYTVGLCGFLFVITLAGQKLLQKFGVASDPRGWFKKVIGIIILALGIAIIFGLDKKLELAISSTGFLDTTKIEQRLLSSSTPQTGKNPFAKSLRYPKAPEITDPSGYINTDTPINIEQFKGKKVVLIDFWTYSCINCQRTLPYLKDWYDKYSDKGLEIIGIHTPEFSFEKVPANVKKAVDGFGIKYPIVLDNNYGTWNAFSNQFWPRKYLIDIDGYIVYDHSGEGNYEETEQAIQNALMERMSRLNPDQSSTTTVYTNTAASPKGMIDIVPEMVRSPEIYFGAERNQYLANGTAGRTGLQNMTIKDTNNLVSNALYLSGGWNFDKEFARSVSLSNSIYFKYSAKNVYFVAAGHNGPVKIHVTRDGKELGVERGADVDLNGDAIINENRLYKLIEGNDYGEHTIEIKIEGSTENSGLEAYTFTFG